MADQTRLVPEEVAVEMVKLKAALNQEEVTISDGFRKSLINRVISALCVWRWTVQTPLSPRVLRILNSHGGRFLTRK